MTILTETFEGTPGGMNLALPQQELDDTEARYIQDGLVDYPGITRRRGPVQAVSGLPTLSRRGTGIVMTLNPQGEARYAVLNGDASNGYLSTLSDDTSSYSADLAWPFALPGDTPYHIVDAKPAVGGGVLIGVSSDYAASGTSQGLALWYGGNKANASKTVSVSRGSAAVTGSGFSGSVVPGMFLFSDTDEGYTSAYVGTVLAVNSDTSITLMKTSPYAITSKGATFQSLRGLAPRVTQGRITCDTTATSVTGGNTKFLSQGLNSGTWQLYRQSDGAFIGKVSSVASEIALTLAANAAVAAADEAYVAIKADADFSIDTTGSVTKVGFLNATYADRQWYANNASDFEKTSRLWFSDTSDPEALDVSVFDGNWIDVTSSSTVNEPIRAIAPAYNGLVIHKENETFILTGASPTDFTVRKLEDDGAISGMSVQQYAGGVIWAGREGIHFYDGIQTENLVQTKLGDYWKNTIRTFDPTQHRMWSMIDRDHYFLFIESVSPTVAVVKGNVSTALSKLTVALNLNTRAVTFHTNLDLRGAIVLPASSGKHIWYLVNGQVEGDASDHGFVCDGEALFSQEGVDPITCDTSAAPGPDFYFESKKYDAGDSLRLKRFKQLSMHYLVQGGDITVDTVLGLNNIGVTAVSTFPESGYTWSSLGSAVPTWAGLSEQFSTWNAVVQSVFLPEKVKFQKKSQHLSFRLYQSTSAITRLQLGPFQVGYKLGRPGRI